MTTSAMKSYRFSSGEDPTDEMLDRLMTNAVRRAARNNREANRKYFDDLHEKCRSIKASKQK